MVEIDWSIPSTFLPVKEESKKERIKSDLFMIFSYNNIFPIIEWLNIWKQLFKDIFK